ncbi:ROK family protein [Roseibium sp.]|uniref:ROK family protein n=1 Tax=Roseibium sp. TaxID=1936156 RepID=UPI003A96AE76
MAGSSGAGGVIVCFDIGGTTIKGAYAHGPQEVVPVPRVPTPIDDFDEFVRQLAGVIEAAPQKPSCVALSIAGIVDPDTNAMIVANIPCIHGRNLVADLERFLKLPVVVANDADCFALTEATYGAGKGHDIVFGAILGSGVGGGLVVRGELINQNGGYAGEWGHGPISALQAGVPARSVPQFACGCGQTGCLDAICSARGLERIHHHLHSRNLTSLEIIDCWEQGNEQAEKTISVYVDLLTGPLAVLVNLTGASLIPVGGGLSNASGLIKRLDEQTRARTLRKFRWPLVVPAQARVEPGLIGAAILGFQRLEQTLEMQKAEA